MRKFIYIFASLALAGTLLAADPFTGTWKLDPSESTGDAIPRDETIMIMGFGNALHVMVRGTDSDGTPMAFTYVVPIAGGDGLVSKGTYDSVSAEQIDDNTRDIAYEKSGNHTEQHEVVSKDGKTMTVTNTGTDAHGNTVNSTVVYYKLEDTQAFDD